MAAASRILRVPKPLALDATFAKLRSLLAAQSKRLIVMVDKSGDYQVGSPTMKDRIGRPLYIAGIKTGKNYVSYHLMPIYMDPGLLKSVSPTLKKRMQGKACFNFTSLEREQAQDLANLTRIVIAAHRDLKLPWAVTAKPAAIKSSGRTDRPARRSPR